MKNLENLCFVYLCLLYYCEINNDVNKITNEINGKTN